MNPNANPATETQEEDRMLLKNETLTEAARKHFKLTRNPFVDDIQSRADVFASQSGRYVRAALWECAQRHGFIAIVGESGSGKTTLREDLQELFRSPRRAQAGGADPALRPRPCPRHRQPHAAHPH